jgi:hypothetical protein
MVLPVVEIASDRELSGTKISTSEGFLVLKYLLQRGGLVHFVW